MSSVNVLVFLYDLHVSFPAANMVDSSFWSCHRYFRYSSVIFTNQFEFISIYTKYPNAFVLDPVKVSTVNNLIKPTYPIYTRLQFTEPSHMNDETRRIMWQAYMDGNGLNAGMDSHNTVYDDVPGYKINYGLFAYKYGEVASYVYWV